MHSKLAFDSKSVCQSRVCADYDRVVNYDEDGNEHVVYELTDYPKIQASLGSFKDWSLQALVDAGIDPRFAIRTGFNTGLAGFNAVNSAINVINQSIESDKKSE